MSWELYDPHAKNKPKRRWVTFLCLAIVLTLTFFTVLA